MRLLLAILSFIFFGNSFAQSSFEKANSAYENEQYEIAIQNYMETLSNGERSADLYYNLGNAYFKTNELGEAIWAYEQAQKLNPSDKDIQFNLQFCNDLTVDKLTINNKGIGNWITKVLFSYSHNFWFYISLLSALITVISLYIFFTPTNTAVNNITLVLGGLFSLILISSVIIGAIHKARLTEQSRIVIIAPKNKILIQPSSESATSFELHEGATANIKSAQDDWYEVELNSNTGWILKEAVWSY